MSEEPVPDDAADIAAGGKSRSRFYCLRMDAPHPEAGSTCPFSDEAIEWLRPGQCPCEWILTLKPASYMVCQVEIRPNTEAGVHWHAYVQLENACTKSVYQRMLGPDVHCELRRKGHDAAKNYCMKLNCKKTGQVTRVNGPWEFGTEVLSEQGKRSDLEPMLADIKENHLTEDQVASKYPGLYLRYHAGIAKLCRIHAEVKKWGVTITHDWQKQLLEVLSSEADWRTIYYVYDTTGNGGKTLFTKFCQDTFNAAVIRPCRSADILYLYKGEKMVFFDIPRSIDDMYVAWGALEQIKDGMWTVAKYSSETRCRKEAAHIVVMSNAPPPELKFSQDRLKLITI